MRRAPWTFLPLFTVACAGSPGLEDNTSNLNPQNPDLVVTAVETPSSFLPWGGAQGSVTACNRGPTYAPPSSVYVYLSQDTNISGMIENPINPDFFAGWIPVDGLQPGACLTRSFPLSGGGPDGAYYVGAVIDEERLVAESNERNNHFLGALVGVGYGPDLRVRAVHTPASTQGTLPVDVEICNDGTSFASFVSANVYLSVDPIITGNVQSPAGADWFLGRVNGTPGGINNGRCVTVHGDFFAPLLVNGPMFVGAIVDEENAVPELIESNNTGASDAFGLGYGPDLIITAIQAPVDAVGLFDASVRVCNQGTAYANPSPINLYFSLDREILGLAYGSSSDPFAATLQTPPLPPSACATIPASLPTSAPNGIYYLAGIVDEDETQSELLEENNTFIGELIGLGSGVDFVVRSVAAAETALAGMESAVTVVVCNEGDVFAPGNSVDLYDVHPPAGPDPMMEPPIGFARFDGLSPHSCSTVRTTVSHRMDGQFTIAGLVDSFNSTPEIQEGNNLRFGNRLAVGNGPDLVITSFTTSPSANWNFDFHARVCNQGTAPSSGNAIDIYLSADDQIDGVMDPWTPDMMLSSAATPSLMPGQCVNLSGNSWISQMFMNPARLGAIVNEFNSEQELLTDNNTSPVVRIGVGNGPDLYARSIGAPATTNRGPITVPVTVCNQGTDFAPQASVRLYSSDDAVLDDLNSFNPDPVFGEALVSNLAPGHCQEASINGSIFGPGAVAYLIASVDPDGAVPELREDNNQTLSSKIGLGNEPDLVIRAIDASFVDLASFSVSIQVCNQGQSYAPSADLEILLSTDQVRDDLASGPNGDFFGFNTRSPDLEVGACATVRQSSPLAAPPGAYYLIGTVDSFQSTPEILEDNNTFVGARVSIGPTPDLYIQSLTGPPDTLGALSLRARVCNRGQGDSTGNQLTVYLSSDETIEGTLNPPFFGDAMAGNFSVPAVRAGQCVSVSGNAFAPVPPGAYFLGGIVNEAHLEQELITEDNTFVGALIGVGSGPDLIATELVAPPVTNGQLALSVRVCNQGTASAPPTDVGILASTDAVIQDPISDPWSTDMFVISAQTPPLEPSQCARISVNTWMPTGFGTFYLAAEVNPFHSLTELISSNNVLLGGLIAVGNGPDLVIQSLTAPNSALSSFTVNARVCNQGNDFAPGAMMQVYLSSDAILDGTDGIVDPFAAVISVPALAPTHCANVSGLAAAPVRMPGAYNLIGVVNFDRSQPELRFDNDTLVGATIGLGSGPDLRITSVSAPASANGSIRASYVVCNQGTAPSSGASVSVYLTADQTVSGSNFVGQGFVGGLATGACTSGSVTGPTSGLSGVFRIGAIVDENGAVLELNEANNTTLGAQVGLGFGSDLIISAISVPTSVDGSFTARARVCNVGTAASAPGDLSLYFSEDTEIEGLIAHPWMPDLFAGRISFGSMSAGQCLTLTQAMVVSAPRPGAYYVGGIVDENGAENELNESNNSWRGALTGVGPGPDLQVSSVRVPINPSASQPFTIGATVCNRGTTAAPPSMVSIYASRDAVLSTNFEDPFTDDILIQTLQVPALNPGACSSPTAQAWWPLGPGNFYLGAYADEWQSVPELIESNNGRISGRFTVRP
ncbi:MAG: CARDB domain-containing protein [Myxococcota bacterium]